MELVKSLYIVAASAIFFWYWIVWAKNRIASGKSKFTSVLLGCFLSHGVFLLGAIGAVLIFTGFVETLFGSVSLWLWSLCLVRLYRVNEGKAEAIKGTRADQSALLFKVSRYYDSDGYFTHAINPSLEIEFSYLNRDREYSSRTISLARYGDNYFGGYCRLRGEFRTFRSHRVSGNVVILKTGEIIPSVELCNFLHSGGCLDFATDDLPQVVELEDPHKVHSSKSSGTQHDPLAITTMPERVEILFTGFEREHRERLESLARERKMIVRQSFTKNLTHLCAGKNAGPSKLTQAAAKGVRIIYEENLASITEV